jgi:dTDP-4-dehydrorhamnose reductase
MDGPRNYITKLLRYDNLLDATNSISHLDEFVAATFACWEKRIPFGTYNVTNPGQVTTQEMVALIKAAGVSGKDFKFFENEADFMQKAAIAPRSNCTMDSSKLARAGIQMTPVAECVQRCLGEWRA